VRKLELRWFYAFDLWRVLFRLNRFAEAIPVVAENVQNSSAQFGPDDVLTLGEMKGHAMCLMAVDRVDEGVAMLNRVLATQTRVLGADNLETRDTRRVLDTRILRV